MTSPLSGQHNAFLVYAQPTYGQPDRSVVKTYAAPGNAELEQKIMDKLYELHQTHRKFPVERWMSVDIQARMSKHPLTKVKAVEFTTLVYAPPGAVLDWIKNNTADIPLEPETIEIGNDGWSVGPCITNQPDEQSYWAELPGIYARVRFNKMSIPFYISSDRKTWDVKQTEAALNHSRSTRLAAPSILKFLETNKDEILKRVAERPLNKSGIAEYEPPLVSFFNKVNTNVAGVFKWKLMFHQGNSNKVDQSKLADPNCTPAVTLRYTRQRGSSKFKDVIVAVLNDKFYEVTKWTDGGGWQGWSGKDVSFYEKDLVDLDTSDEYVYERAVRALRSKL